MSGIKEEGSLKKPLDSSKTEEDGYQTVETDKELSPSRDSSPAKSDDVDALPEDPNKSKHKPGGQHISREEEENITVH